LGGSPIFASCSIEHFRAKRRVLAVAAPSPRDRRDVRLAEHPGRRVPKVIDALDDDSAEFLSVIPTSARDGAVSTDAMFDLYVWRSPRDVDASSAHKLVAGWHDSGSVPARSRFEPSTDVGWFYREVVKDLPGLEASSDVAPNRSKAPIVLSTRPEAPARVVGLRLAPDTQPAELEAIFGLAAKYDLILFDRRSGRVHRPLEAMAAHASATFWPSGAIQAAVAGVIGGVIAVVAWFVGIPLLSGLLVLVGGFLVAMAGYTFVHVWRKTMRARRNK
jgi:hypothetical protein